MHKGPAYLLCSFTNNNTVVEKRRCNNPGNRFRIFRMMVKSYLRTMLGRVLKIEIQCNLEQQDRLDVSMKKETMRVDNTDYLH